MNELIIRKLRNTPITKHKRGGVQHHQTSIQFYSPPSELDLGFIKDDDVTKKVETKKIETKPISTVNRNEIDRIGDMLRLTNKPEGTSTFQRAYIWNKDEHQDQVKNLDKRLFFETNAYVEYNEAKAREINREKRVKANLALLKELK